MAYEKQGFEDGQILTAEKLIRMEDGIQEAFTGIKRVESGIDGNPVVNLRDLESGTYYIYGPFSPYENSNTYMHCNDLVHVTRKTAGSHIICLGALNAKIIFIEILVDDTAPKGFTYERKNISLLDLDGLIARVEALEAAANAGGATDEGTETT